jgi:hypothetical protein
MRHGGKWLLLILLVAGGYLGWRHFRGGPAGERTLKAEDPALLLNRVWIDSRPKKAQDFINVLFVTDRLPLGIFQRASAFRLLAERFEYHRDGRVLGLTFPQSKRNDRVSFEIRACNDLPPMDLCLELSRNPWEGGPTRFYSKRESEKSDELLKLQRELESRR